jgi:hypothetical protein
MTLLVRDEEDIIEANIDYHLSRGVDFIIATDNKSVDNTAEILRTYERQGLLHYIYEPDDDYSQYKWVTRMARLAATEFSADWIINNDADEFWWPDADADLKSCLGTVPNNHLAVSVNRFNFPLQAQLVESSDPFFERLTLCDLKSVNSIGAPLPPKSCHRALKNIEVSQGNHAVSINGQPVPTYETALSIFHFPVRSFAQFENKIRLGGAAYARNTEINANVGMTWRLLFERYQEGNFEAEFLKQVLSQDTVKSDTASGRLKSDVRLRDWMRAVRN